MERRVIQLPYDATSVRADQRILRRIGLVGVMNVDTDGFTGEQHAQQCTLHRLRKLDFHLIFLWGSGRIDDHGERVTAAYK